MTVEVSSHFASMNLKTNRIKVAQIAAGLRELLKRKSEYEQLIRQVRWGERALAIVGEGSMLPASLTAACAFESLLGWPVVAREAAEFKAYALPTIQPRSVVMAVSPSGENEALVSLAQAAIRRGATVLGVTENSEGSLANIARGIFRLPGIEPVARAQTNLIQHAALAYIAIIAAGVFNPPQAQGKDLEEEFKNLPDHMEWLQTHLADAVRSLASEVKETARLALLGRGFYYPVALEAAAWTRETTSGRIEAPHLAIIGHGPLRGRWSRDDCILFLSGSNCRTKRVIQELASELKKSQAKLLAITDRNDRHLSDLCKASILLPVLPEIPSALLALALLEWLIAEAAVGK